MLQEILRLAVMRIVRLAVQQRVIIANPVISFLADLVPLVELDVLLAVQPAALSQFLLHLLTAISLIMEWQPHVSQAALLVPEQQLRPAT